MASADRPRSAAMPAAKSVPPPLPDPPRAGRRRTKPVEERRTELLDAAQQLFLAKGAAATSVDEIVVAASVAKGTFYLYFDSKEALLAALQERFVSAIHAALREAVDRHRPEHAALRLRTWIATLATTFLQQVALHDMVFHDLKPHDRRRLSGNPVIAQLETLLADGHRQGAWRAPSTRRLAVMLFHGVHGVLDDAVARGETEPAQVRSITREATTFVERMLGLR